MLYANEARKLAANELGQRRETVLAKIDEMVLGAIKNAEYSVEISVDFRDWGYIQEVLKQHGYGISVLGNSFRVSAVLEW